MNLKEAKEVAGSLGYPSKMPGTSYGISAKLCHVGAKLAQVEGSVCHGCYALKGHYVHDSVAKAHAKRLTGIADPRWTAAMVTMLLHEHAKPASATFAPGWHRWHDSGDFQSVEHITKVCAVAALTPHIEHWCPTREVQLLAQYIKQGGIVPPNLTIRVSATMVDGAATKTWPTTSGVFHKREAIGHKCPAPTTNNNCGSCRACWDRKVPHVEYHKH